MFDGAPAREIKRIHDQDFLLGEHIRPTPLDRSAPSRFVAIKQ
jgi:hypothetical protein